MKLNKTDLIRCANASLNEYAEKKWYQKKKLKPVKCFDYINRFDTNSVQGHFGKKGNVLYIVFRGSEGDEPGRPDWETNFKFSQITLNIVTKIKVHLGFLIYYKKVKKKILKKAKKYDMIVVTGISLGGGLAVLCAENIKYKFPKKDVTCVPLSAPRVGNSHFKKHFDDILPDTYRIYYGDDTVVRLPPWFFGYRHVSKAIKLMKNYFNPINWLTFLFSAPWEHCPSLLLREMQKQL